MPSAYLDKPRRSLCPVCRERPAKQETEICERCEQNSQADVDDNVVDLQFERVERVMAGEER